MDENWKVLWHSVQMPEIGELRGILHIPEHFWGNQEMKFPFGDRLYTCTLRCSREDGIRVFHVQPPAGMTTVDPDALTEIVQNMISGLTAQYRMLDDDAALDQIDYFNTTAGNLLRIYRMLYLYNELERGRTGNWSSGVFSVSIMVRTLFKEMRSILRSAAHLELEEEAEALFTEGDAAAFRNVILSAFLLCIRKPEQFQMGELRLFCDGAYACVDISVCAEHEERRDRNGQLSNFGSTDGERELIAAYSERFGAQVLFREEEDRSCCLIKTKLAEDRKCIDLHSGTDRGKDGFYDPISVMLSRFCFRRYF